MVGITLTNPTELELDVDPLRLPPQGTRASPVKQRQTWGVKMMRGDGAGGFAGFPISPIVPAQNKKH